MKVVAIAAVADNGVIGSGQEMLWHISEDFRRFKTVTMGHTLIFGRRTFEQIGKLPGRRHIICCLLYTSPSPRDRTRSRMPSSA